MDIVLAVIGIILAYIGVQHARRGVEYARKQYLLQKKETEKRKASGDDKGKPLEIPPLSLPPYIAHPYPLQENFTGRDEERKMLSKWLEKGAEPMLALIAIGGMGKSSLAWYWVQEDIIGQGKAPEGLIWWSFYGKDSGFEAFVKEG